MPETDIGQAVVTTNTQTDFSVPAETTDNSNINETRWHNEKWTTYFGYYKASTELAAVIDANTTWTVGKGFTADPDTTMLFDSIRGWGKDSFNTIIENMIRVYHIGGDSFAEKIFSDDGRCINLKTLDP